MDCLGACFDELPRVLSNLQAAAEKDELDVKDEAEWGEVVRGV